MTGPIMTGLAKGTTMGNSVLILGASGGFGLALTEHMVRSGWRVKALSRKPNDNDTRNQSRQGSIEWLIGDVSDNDSLQRAAYGVKAIVHAINVPYPKWDPLMIDYTRRIVELARQHDAQLFFVGNIYNAGIPDSGVIDANTPDHPVNNKGEIRVQLERMIRQGANPKVTTTIMRFGDFFGPEAPATNWFKQSAKDIHKNKLVLPGPADIKHTWAYLPDAVAAMEKVIAIRLQDHASDKRLDNHMVLPFAGHRFSFDELKQQLENDFHTQLAIKTVPWELFKVMGVFVPLFRDLVDMRYLWNHDLRIDDSALVSLLGKSPHQTPLDEAITASLPAKRGNVASVTAS